MAVYPLAGDGFYGDLSKFERLGIKVDYSKNVKFMQVPIIGSPEFIRAWVEQKMRIIKKQKAFGDCLRGKWLYNCYVKWGTGVG